MAERSKQLGPGALVALGIGALSVAATAIWFTARAQGALIYGLVRSVELPFFSSYLPFAEYFTLSSLRRGVVPSFEMIYINSVVYGLFFAAMILVTCFVALGRLDKFHIKKHVEINDPKGVEHGRTYEQIMERYAVTQPDVRFFLDYPLLDLSLIYGVGRQPMTALDFLVYSGGIKAVVIDKASGHPPSIRLDEKRLRHYYVNRLFGPRNPFLEIPSQRLIDVQDIERAVDNLRWDAAILLYASLWRFQAFYVEADSKGYEKITDDVEAYIQSVWSEINELKKEFGQGIELGFDSSVHRREREERYALTLKKGGDKKGRTYEPNIDLENVSHYARVQMAGREDDESEMDFIPAELRETYGVKNHWKGKNKKKPDQLLFAGEIMAIRAPHFETVKTARDGLKLILCRHLSGQTGKYPVGLDDETRTVIYKAEISDGAEQAFNSQAQQRLNDAASRITKIVFGHTWSFGVVGDALESVRESGIMPPNLFRFLRFCRETRSMWWFVQNLGAPSAYPENAALMEHYNAERATGMALLRPYILSSISGLKAEAEKYLTDETTEDLIKLLGKGGLVDLVKERRAAEREAMRRVAQKNGPASVRGGIFAGNAYTEDFISSMETEEQYRQRLAANDGKPDGIPEANPLPLGKIDPIEAARVAAEQSGTSMMEMLRNKVLPRQIELLQVREKQRKMAQDMMGASEDAQDSEKS